MDDWWFPNLKIESDHDLQLWIMDTQIWADWYIYLWIESGWMQEWQQRKRAAEAAQSR